MPMDAITDTGPLPGLAPFSLKDAPALIERVFPAQKVGIESQKERKAVQGQTLTALGSYWKGRKPLVLVRACILACLLPATSDAEKDLEIFEALMRMDVDGLSRRLPEVTAEHVWESPAVRMDDKIEHIEPSVDNAPDESPEVNDLNVAAVRKCKAKWRTLNPLQPDHKVGRDERSRVDAIRDSLRATALSAMPFSQQVSISERTEKVESLQCQDDPVYVGIWPKINAHLGTDALTLPQLIEQLGVARYGRRPIVGDPFCGGGSIPFEAARVGCDVEATDLNPIAAMLT